MFPVNTIIAWYVNIYHKYEDMIITTLLLPLGHISNSNYGKLEESHVKLSSSHEDLLVSHGRLKLAHEAIMSKVTSSGPHVDISTISTSNVILPCASPCSSSYHNHDISRDELHSVPCCSNNVAPTSSSTFVETNHVEEIKELKTQVTSLKNDLKKGHQGKVTLNKILSVQNPPNDKSGLGFNSNVKNKSTIKLKHKDNKKNGQDQVKNPSNIVCFKCKEEGHHLRSCPFKKKPLSVKQQGKRPQAPPQVINGPLPKRTTRAIPRVVASPKKKDGKSRTCYICREKGHISSSCTISISSSNPIIIDDAYSICKDEVGNVFAKFVGAQCGFKKRTIWVAKPIVTNLLGPNLVGDQQAKT